MRKEVTKHTYSVIIGGWDVNPEPCIRMVVQSLFDTQPSDLSSKWERLEAVNS